MKTKPIFLVRGPTMLSPLSYSIKFGVRNLETNSLAVALPVVMQQVKEYEAAPSESMLELHNDDATEAFQSLLEQLWLLGFRPKDIGTVGHLAATQQHLADMRALVSKTYEVVLP